MNLSKSFRTCVFDKYADFKGRASRSEYWWFWLICTLCILGLPLLDFLLYDIYGITLYSVMFLWAVLTIGLLCPFVAVSIRRLHDSGLSGWHVLWRVIPYIGSIITAILMCRKSVSNINKRNNVNKSDNMRTVYSSEKDSGLKIFCKKFGISLLLAAFCFVGIGSLYYFPIFILLFIYYEYLIWRKKSVNVTDVLLLPLLQRVGLYKNIDDTYVLKKKLLVFASVLVGTIFIAYCTFGLSLDDYDAENEGIIIGLLIIDLLAWVVFFFYEYGIQWLKDN